MAVRQGPLELAAADAQHLRRALGDELRQTRIALGLSQRAVAAAARVSASRLGRIERNQTEEPSVAAMCRVARTLGLTVSIKLYPAGTPVRDAASLALAARFRKLVAAPLRLRGELVLPGPGDLRAWDGLVAGDDAAAFTEYEGRLGDIQALARRIELKLRDDPRAGAVILVVARTRHNTAVLRQHREVLRQQFPLDGAAIARALRAGRVPTASGILAL